MGESLTINSDDIDFKNCAEKKIEYFTDSKNTKTIKLNDKGISLELNEGQITGKFTTVAEIGKQLGFVRWQRQVR